MTKDTALTSPAADNTEYDDFHSEYENKQLRNSTILQGMSARELEEHLKDFAYAGRRQSRESTKNVAHEVISCIIDLNHGCKGILTDIIKWLKSVNQRVVLNLVNKNWYTYGSDGFGGESSLQDNKMISGTVYFPHAHENGKFDK